MKIRKKAAPSLDAFRLRHELFDCGMLPHWFLRMVNVCADYERRGLRAQCEIMSKYLDHKWNITIHLQFGDDHLYVSEGDWVIREEKGGQYVCDWASVCKDDVFRATYEPVDDAVPLTGAQK